MNALIDAAYNRSKVVQLVLVFLLAVGSLSYIAIPKESNPEIPIPIVFVSASVDGISPEDSEDVLVGPLENEFASLTGLKSMTAIASEGRGAVQLDFEPGFDADEALDKVREGADRVEDDLPSDATVIVTEINTALFPILTVILSGPVPERTLNALAEDLQDDIAALSGVLEVDVAGKRTALMEVLIDPTVFETYNITFNELISSITNNNQLIAAGAIDLRGVGGDLYHRRDPGGHRLPHVAGCAVPPVHPAGAELRDEVGAAAGVLRAAGPADLPGGRCGDGAGDGALEFPGVSADVRLHGGRR